MGHKTVLGQPQIGHKHKLNRCCLKCVAFDTMKSNKQTLTVTVGL